MNPIVAAITWLRERPQLLRAVFFTSLVLFVLFDVFAARHEPHFGGDYVRGFWAVYGLFGSLLMAKFMKGLGHTWLMKPEGYWNGERGED
jgi:hypothetical protein